MSEEKTSRALRATGIAYMVVGGWNALMGLPALLFMYAFGAFREMAAVSETLMPFMQISMLFCSAFGLLALAAGIGLLRQRPWGRKVAETTAWIFLAFIVTLAAFIALLLAGTVAGTLKVFVVGITVLSMLCPAALLGWFIHWLRSPKVRAA